MPAAVPDQQHIVRKTIVINAPAADVWEALTNPELTRKYFYGCRVHSDWKQGSEITFKRRFLWMKIEMKGQIIKAEPGKLLQYTLENKAKGKQPASRSMVTDALQADGNKTILSITDDVGAGEGAEKRYERSVKGWDKVLNGLKDLLEKR